MRPSPLLNRPGAVASAPEDPDQAVPAHLGDPGREQAALAEGRAVCALARDVVTVTGPDRLSWLTTLSSQVLTGLEPGDGGAETTEPAEDDADTKASGGPLVPVTQLELVSADPAGHVAVWEGWIQGPRAQVGTQAVGRARTAVPVEEMTRMFGLVGGDLMWTQDMAAFGQSEVTTYASGRLGRVDDLDDPAAQPGSALDPAEPEGESSTSSSPASDDAEPTV